MSIEPQSGAATAAWLGHRDLCPLQWSKWPCDCPCTDPTCPGVDRCQGGCALSKSFLSDEAAES